MNSRSGIESESASTAENQVQDISTDALVPDEEGDVLLSMFPVAEEVSNTIEKDGISFLFESRSLSSVVRYIYTPIDGTFADIEIEINNADPIHPADEGGITIEMGGGEWLAASEEIERHFVSCEQIGDCVEARWQWKCGEELADFLFRLSIEAKSLIVELEGGNGKATGVHLGRITGAIHPRLFSVPYFNLGDGSPHILCTAGVFISSLLDWNQSQASSLWAPDSQTARQVPQLNGGCSYLPNSAGKRHFLQERWLLTVSRQFEEVLPDLPIGTSGVREELQRLLWYNIPHIPQGEESYVNLYELLRTFKQWGMDDVLINHPGETWHDGDGNATLTLEGAPGKGGGDALSEYLEAVADLEYPFSLYTNYREISASNSRWNPELGALLSDGNPALSGPDQHLLKPEQAVSLAAEHTRAIAEKYHNPVLYIGTHASLPPWAHNDFDSRTEEAGSFLTTLRAQQTILGSQISSQPGPVVGEGGNHWLYPGLLNGYLARQSGDTPSENPLLVDFDLRYLHPLQTDAGLGTVEEFFGGAISDGEKHGRSAFLDRFLAVTVAYGHAGVLPDPVEWGLGAAVKTYYLLRKLQTYYLGVPVISIHYHHEDNLLETTEALVSGAYEHSQAYITYENGLQVYVNGGWEEEWRVEREERTFSLPPGSFLAHGPDGLLVYSADSGSGRIDFAQCAEYLYCDTRGKRLKIGPVFLDGAVLVLQKKWKIDLFPIDCQTEIEVDLSHFWSERRLPPLRVLAFKPDEEEPDNLKASISGQKLGFQPIEGAFKYRITLPEWMVEPGQ